MIDRRDTVPSALDDERVDRVVAMLTEASRARVRTLIDGAHVRIGGVIVTKSAQRVRAGDEIVVEFDEEEPAVKADSTIALTVVHEDLDVVVVDKPAGLVCILVPAIATTRSCPRCWPAIPTSRTWATRGVPASCTGWTKARRAC